jgi:hypothetical protein
MSNPTRYVLLITILIAPAWTGSEYLYLPLKECLVEFGQIEVQNDGFNPDHHRIEPEMIMRVHNFFARVGRPSLSDNWLLRRLGWSRTITKFIMVKCIRRSPHDCPFSEPMYMNMPPKWVFERLKREATKK